MQIRYHTRAQNKALVNVFSVHVLAGTGCLMNVITSLTRTQVGGFDANTFANPNHLLVGCRCFVKQTSTTHRGAWILQAELNDLEI